MSTSQNIFQEIEKNRLLIKNLIKSMIKSEKIPDLEERVKLDLDDYYIVVGPNIAIYIDINNGFYETSLCFSQGDEDESYYNKRNDTKWITELYIPQMGYGDVKRSLNIIDEINKVIEYVKKYPEIIANEVSKAREKLQKLEEENDLIAAKIMNFYEYS